MNLEEQKLPQAEGFRDHPRMFERNSFVYPVLSRRSGGISLGINLSPHKRCNFDCPYCQVDRSPGAPVAPPYNLQEVEKELNQTLDLILSGQIFQVRPFDRIPPQLRRLNDIALSGDGEPTAEKDFLATCELCARIKTERKLEDIKLVLITNATLFHRPAVREGMGILAEHNGQIWAKLDAGTEAFYKFINKTTIPFQRVLDNLLRVGRERPIIIQTLFPRIDGSRIEAAEVAAYARRLADLAAAGARIDHVQLYTIARRPADSRLSSLSAEELEAIAGEIVAGVNVPIQIYYGQDEDSQET